MTVIDLQFVAKSATVKAPNALTIRPKIVCEIDTPGSEVKLSFSIATGDVNLEIKDPDDSVTIEGTTKSFRKEITFLEKDTGTEKEF
ncbi:MAG: hypothetical protein WDO15_21740 [Bacteroidota bacterium]